MKKQRRQSQSHRRPAPTARSLPVRRSEIDVGRTIQRVCELYPMTDLIGNSYVLSRFWSWFTHIEFSPKLSVPMPRFFTYRDP